jgi:hypothetical protein
MQAGSTQCAGAFFGKQIKMEISFFSLARIEFSMCEDFVKVLPDLAGRLPGETG